MTAPMIDLDNLDPKLRYWDVQHLKPTPKEREIFQEDDNLNLIRLVTLEKGRWIKATGFEKILGTVTYAYNANWVEVTVEEVVMILFQAE